MNEGPRQQDAQQDQRAEDHGQQREQPRRELARPRRAPFGQGPGVGGDEGGGEGSLREEVAQQVGDAEGGLEGVGVEARAQEGLEHLLAGQAQEPRQQRQRGDQSGGAHPRSRVFRGAEERRAVDLRAQDG